MTTRVTLGCVVPVARCWGLGICWLWVGCLWYLKQMPIPHPHPNISRDHPLYANAEQIRTFSGLFHFFVPCTKISFRRGGYV